MKGTDQYIQIATDQGLVIVKSKRFDSLAVHRPAGWNGGEDVWTISHIPTGMAVAEQVPKEQVRDLLGKLEPLDWNFTHPLRIPTETYVAARRIIPEEFRRQGPTDVSDWEQLQQSKKAALQPK